MPEVTSTFPGPLHKINKIYLFFVSKFVSFSIFIARANHTAFCQFQLQLRFGIVVLLLLLPSAYELVRIIIRPSHAFGSHSRAIFASFCCHNVTVPGVEEHHSRYPSIGLVRAHAALGCGHTLP